jgi:hypothetical protein
MKKPILLFLLTLISLAVQAQRKVEAAFAPEMPVDSITHLITYEGVLEVKGVVAPELYKRTLDWFRSYYKNPSEVIRENDSLKMRITGKPRFKIQNPPDKNGLKTDAGMVQYTIMVAAKDGRFRYELTEFNWKQTSYYPCERWLDESASSFNPVYFDYLRQLDATAEQVVTQLHESLSHAKGEKNREDW